MSKLIDETGNRYGRLVVIKRAENDRHGKAHWLCQCDCGNKKIVAASALRRGLTISCGCNKSEKLKKYNDSKVINEINNTYGYLTVISRNTDKKYQKDGRAMWNCKCICGNTCVVSGRLLRNGHTTSCGCRSKSIGEETIEKLLLSKNISYVMEYPIKVPNREHKLRIDFIIFNNNNNNIECAIEYDGEQHFSYKNNGTFCRSEEDLKDIQKRDMDKNQWCKDNNIPLIRIPYWHLENLCIEDLLPETSKYIME